MRKLIVTSLAVCTTIMFCHGQSVLEDFKKINAHYSAMKHFKLNFNISYVGNDGNNLMTQKGEVLYAENLKYSNVSGMINLVNDKEFISVMADKKLLVYNKAVDVKERAEQSMVQPDVNELLDSLWSNRSDMKVSMLPSKSGFRKVLIEQEKSKYYDGYLVKYTTDDYRLIQYSQFTRESANSQLAEIRIDYLEETDNPRINNEEYKISYYLKGKPGKLKATERFSSYRIIDQTIKSANYEY